MNYALFHIILITPNQLSVTSKDFRTGARGVLLKKVRRRSNRINVVSPLWNFLWLRTGFCPQKRVCSEKYAIQLHRPTHAPIYLFAFVLPWIK